MCKSQQLGSEKSQLYLYFYIVCESVSLCQKYPNIPRYNYITAAPLLHYFQPRHILTVKSDKTPIINQNFETQPNLPRRTSTPQIEIK